MVNSSKANHAYYLCASNGNAYHKNFLGSENIRVFIASEKAERTSPEDQKEAIKESIEQAFGKIL